MNRHGSLNRIYRLVWSQVTNSWVAVAENVKGRGKGKNTARKLVAAALALSAVTWLLPEAIAGPTPIGKLLFGPASVTQSGSVTTITQSTQQALLNWNGFNVGTGQTVDFTYKPGVSFVSVNEIAGNNGSNILGTINAPLGEIFLINPNGIVFGKNAQVNVGGLVASALGTTGTDSSGMHFSGTGNVVNHGTITAGSHVVLLGSSVTNDGSIATAPLGTIILGAGNSATLTMNNSQVSLKIDGSTMQNLIANGGLIQAEGGTIIMTAGAIGELQASVVNNTGVVQAHTVGSNNGHIELLADKESGPNTVGGTVIVGGTLDASAPDGGNGGNIETSAGTVKTLPGFIINTSAPSGKTGSWLIDPYDFNIGASLAEPGDISGSELTTALLTTDVTIQTTAAAATCTGIGCPTGGTYNPNVGNINVNDPVNWGTSHVLTLNAWNNINVNQPITLTANGTLIMMVGQSAVNASNPNSITYNAPVNLANNSIFKTQLGYDGSLIPYSVINSLGSDGVVNSNDGSLQGIPASGSFVLGSNIDASGTGSWTAGFTPIGTANNFTGTFDGLGHTITGLTINNSQLTQSGLFATVEPGSIIRNVGLVNESVSSTGPVGGLAAHAYQITVSNAYVTGNLQSSSDNVAGLIGNANNSNISFSHFNGTVAGADNIGGIIGIGTNNNISNNYASGSVSGTGGGVGGLIGNSQNDNISNNYFTGSVTANNANTGGLIGVSQTDTITNNYTDGSVSGTYCVGGLIGSSALDTVDSNYALTSVFGKDAGGLIGESASTVRNNYSVGSVSGSDATSIGGLIGLLAGGTVTSSYWNTTNNPGVTVGIGSVSTFTTTGITGLTTQAMQNTASFNGFHFTTTPGLSGDYWVMVATDGSIITAGNNGAAYPMLSAEYSTTISNAHQLQLVSLDLTANYRLANNIDATATNTKGGTQITDVWNTPAGFLPLGNSNNDFTGTFDGAGYTINGLTVQNPYPSLVGLFGEIDVKGTVGNVHLTNVNITGTDNTGALAGLNAGLVTNSSASGTVASRDNGLNTGVLVGTNYGTVTGSSAFGTVSGGLATAAMGGLAGLNTGTISYSNAAVMVEDSNTGSATNYFGGLAGKSVGGSISNCSASGAVNGDPNVGYYVGGLVGYNKNTPIDHSSASGNVTGYEYVGGLLGASYGSAISYIQTATGTVSGQKYVGGMIGLVNGSSVSYGNAGGSVTGSSYVGGFIGQGTGTNTISHDHATGEVSGVEYVGGLMGMSSAGSISASDAAGDVTANGDYIGGLVGLNNSSIDGCHAGGAVQGGSYVGGLAGKNNAGNISNSFATGNVMGSNEDTGGLAGWISAGNISNSFASGTVTGVINTGGLAGYVTSSATTISNCHAIGAVNSTAPFDGGLVGLFDGGTISGGSYASGSVNGVAFVGGLVGLNSGGLITNSSATGNVTNNVSSGAHFFGGLVGDNGSGSTVTNSFATGTVILTAPGVVGIGGLAGINDGFISNSYALGMVNGGAGSVAAGGVAGANYGTIVTSFFNGTVAGAMNTGGVAGHNYGSGTIMNSYAVGAVQGGSNAGGLAGQNDGSINTSYSAGIVTGSSTGGLVAAGSGPVTNSFWDLQTSGQATSPGGGFGMHTADMQQQTNFTAANSGVNSPSNVSNNPNWDFNGTWFMYSGSTYPLLQVFMTQASVALNGSPVTTTYNGMPYNLAGNITLTDNANNPIALPNAHISGTLNGPINAGTYNGGAIFVPGSIYSDQLGYMITSYTGSLTINPIQLTVTGQTANNKVYDGTSTATFVAGSGQLLPVVPGQGVVPGDNVTLNQSGDFYGNVESCIDSGVICYTTQTSVSNAGYHFITTTDTLSNNPYNNYVLVQPSTQYNPTIWATITPAPLTVQKGTETAGTKVYDGTTLATVTGGILSGTIYNNDQVTLNESGVYTSKDVGTGGPISITTNDSLSNGNYMLSAQPNDVTGLITPRPLTVTGQVPNNKVADGTPTATFSQGTLVGVVAGQGVVAGDTVTFAESGNFTQSTAGTHIPVYTTDTLTSNPGNDYSLTQPSPQAAPTMFANITPASTVLTVTGEQVAFKIYNGSTLASLSGGKLSGTINANDTVTLNQSGYFTSPNANIVKGGSCDGISGFSCNPTSVVVTDTLTVTCKTPPCGSYTLAPVTVPGYAPNTLPGYILPAVLVAGGTAQNKVYDGTTKATMTNLNYSDFFAGYGVVSGQTVNLAESGVFASKNVGKWNVAVTDTMSVNPATTLLSNYYLWDPTFTTTASITQATLTYLANGITDHTTGMATAIGGNVVGFVGTDTLANATTGTPVWTTSACTVVKGACTPKSNGVFSITGSGVKPDGNYKPVIVQATNTALAAGATGNNATALCVGPACPLTPGNHSALPIQREITEADVPAVVDIPATESQYLPESVPAGGEVKQKLPGLQIKDGGVKLPDEVVAMN